MRTTPAARSRRSSRQGYGGSTDSESRTSVALRPPSNPPHQRPVPRSAPGRQPGPAPGGLADPPQPFCQSLTQRPVSLASWKKHQRRHILDRDFVSGRVVINDDLAAELRWALARPAGRRGPADRAGSCGAEKEYLKGACDILGFTL